jgi:nicotinate-nucleotide adenylyltransferase
VLGGTFDPPHHGHLAAAVGARDALALDRVLLVVANRPWQKMAERPISPAADRLAMTHALVAGWPGLEVSELEIKRGGDSYTADTLAALRAADPAGSLHLILGADAVAGLPTWERHEELPALAVLAMVSREGVDTPPVPEGWTSERVEIARLDISSSDLRARVAAGRSLGGLTPASVVSLIERRRLYRGEP